MTFRRELTFELSHQKNRHFWPRKMVRHALGYNSKALSLSILASFSGSTLATTTQGGCNVDATPCESGSPASYPAISNTLEPKISIQSGLTFEEGEAIILEEIKNGRVVNGQAVTDSNTAPFYSRILSCANGNGGCSICGSSWITGKTLVTAAHCVDANVDGSNPNHNVYVYPWRDGGVVGGGSYREVSDK